MDEKKATKILAKELGNKIGREAVIEDSYKDDLIRNASSAYQVDSPFLIDFSEGKFQGKKSGEDIVEIMLLQKDSFAEANYYFLKTIPQVGRGQSYSKDSQFAVTPYALIGEKEKTSLRKLFYKNVHPEIAYAMSALGIDNFIDFYKYYKDSSFNSSFDYLTTPTRTILKKDLEVVKKFIDFTTKLKYDRDEEVEKKVFKQFDGIDSLNARLERLGVTTLIEPRITSNHTPSDYVPRKVISQVIEQLSDLNLIKTINKRDKPLLNEFGEFVFFSLPYEEQSIESNKRILKDSLNLDFVIAVLSKEYSEGKHFQEYFDVLDKEAQDKVVESLKVFSGRKPVYDSFLWSKGFKDVNLDYLVFYKENTKGFIEYFNKSNFEEKKTILKDIMSSDFINEDVVKWLNEHEAELIREVGLNG